jgi:ferrous iron transport protein B
MRSDRKVVLIGAPNSGKTTLYNWLTNSKFKTVNYPGATVEYAVGSSAERIGTPAFTVIDTPGTYSLFPKSQDEEVTLKVLTRELPFGRANQVLVVVDGTQLARHLLLAKQVRETGLPFVIVVTMADLLRKSGVELDKSVLEKEFEAPVVLFDGLLGGGLDEIAATLRRQSPGTEAQTLEPWADSVLAAKLGRLEHLAKEALPAQSAKKIDAIYERSSKIDRVLLHPFWGLVLFFAIMSTLFVSIYWLATPFMDGIDSGFTWMAEWVKAHGEGSLIADFLADGILLSFSAVLVFVPQIFILFLGIGLLESSGYLARAATLIDRPFSKVGLTGRAFVPVLSGFACAVPAIMATRNLSSKRDRWITNFIIPLMTCSARLPVYALLLGFLYQGEPAWKPGLALAALYFGALLVGSVSAAILNRILAQADRSFLMMELPLYRRPRLRVLLAQTLTRTRSYVKRAGPVIFVLAVLIWVSSTFPNARAETDQAKLEASYLAQAGHYVNPIFEPMGVDWRVGVGLMSAFAAREVFVSTLAMIFNVQGDEDSRAEGLLKEMGQATSANGSKIFTTATVMGLLVFFMIALQCMSTFAIQVKESGSTKFALVQLVLFNVAAYALAVGIVHGLRAFGVA